MTPPELLQADRDIAGDPARRIARWVLKNDCFWNAYHILAQAQSLSYAKDLNIMKMTKHLNI